MFGAFGTVHKGQEKRLGELKSRERIDIIQSTTLLQSAKKTCPGHTRTLAVTQTSVENPWLKLGEKIARSKITIKQQGEKENYKYLGILDYNTVNQAEMKKIRKNTSEERENLRKLSSAAESVWILWDFEI